MNRLLRRVSKSVRYRALPSLTSQVVRLESLDTIAETVSGWVGEQVQWPVRFQGPEAKYMSFSVFKYGILDLTYQVTDFRWTADDLRGIPLLKKLSFAMHRTEGGTLSDEGEDPTCLTELDQDIQKHETLLRLFLEKKPGHFFTPEYMKEMIRSGRMQRILAAAEAGGEEFRLVVGECFPDNFVVTDACITNAGFVWFHKHSYL